MIRPNVVACLEVEVPRDPVTIWAVLIHKKRVYPSRHGHVVTTAIGIVGLVRACVTIPYHESGVVGHIVALEVDYEEVSLG
jgi:hypothetical protein